MNQEDEHVHWVCLGRPLHAEKRMKTGDYSSDRFRHLVGGDKGRDKTLTVSFCSLAQAGLDLTPRAPLNIS